MNTRVWHSNHVKWETIWCHHSTSFHRRSSHQNLWLHYGSNGIKLMPLQTNSNVYQHKNQNAWRIAIFGSYSFEKNTPKCSLNIQTFFFTSGYLLNTLPSSKSEFLKSLAASPAIPNLPNCLCHALKQLPRLGWTQDMFEDIQIKVLSETSSTVNFSKGRVALKHSNLACLWRVRIESVATSIILAHKKQRRSNCLQLKVTPLTS